MPHVAFVSGKIGQQTLRGSPRFFVGLSNTSIPKGQKIKDCIRVGAINATKITYSALDGAWPFVPEAPKNLARGATPGICTPKSHFAPAGVTE